MALQFDEVIHALLEVGLSDPVLRGAARVAVVRDPVGRVRLAIDGSANEAARTQIEEALETKLGGWYAGPAIFKEGGRAETRLATQVLERAYDQEKAKGKWPPSWPTEVEDSARGTKTAIGRTRWGGIERVLSKETWLSDQSVSSPWPLHDKTPSIVSFYSYKGGVGRSTLVAIVAAILARAGEKVVVVDLDLEAPGQQALFETTPSRGVLDYLVEHLALGGSEIDGLLEDVTPAAFSGGFSAGFGNGAGSVHLAAAGKAGWSYVQKVARLDFVGHTREGESPVQAALTSLLREIKKQHAPDWILLDARTGIHDLGGLAIHALAHIDVFLAREGRQGIEGLELCLGALARRREPDDIRTLMVHALAPAALLGEDVSRLVGERFRRVVYERFRSTIYQSERDVDLPAEVDTSAPHTPYAIPLDPALATQERLGEMHAILDRDHYTKIVERLRELAMPESP